MNRRRPIAIVSRPQARRLSLVALWVFGLAFAITAAITGCGSNAAPPISTENESATPAADPIGERLFLDTRFAKFFFLHMTSINAPLSSGDPIVATVPTANGSLP